MRHLPISGFPIIEPEDADPEIAELYAQAQQETNLPFVPNWAKATAFSPAGLVMYLDVLRTVNRHISLPQSLVPMILYAIATSRNCTYCSGYSELYCRNLGVDESTLELVAKDLENVTPQRLQAIIAFAMKCAFNAQGLTAADYEQVRDQGITDEEMGQIIFLAALANLNDTLADSFKMEIDPAILEALGR